MARSTARPTAMLRSRPRLHPDTADRCDTLLLPSRPLSLGSAHLSGLAGEAWLAHDAADRDRHAVVWQNGHSPAYQQYPAAAGATPTTNGSGGYGDSNGYAGTGPQGAYVAPVRTGREELRPEGQGDHDLTVS